MMLDGFVWVVIIAVAAMFGFAGWLIIDERIHCTKYEKQWVHHPAYTQFIHSGKTTIVIPHAAHDSLDDVCVKRDDR